MSTLTHTHAHAHAQTHTNTHAHTHSHRHTPYQILREMKYSKQVELVFEYKYLPWVKC